MDITHITPVIFFEYACTHKIIYPAHSIHVLQGLNVVVFATVKHCLCEEQDKWESETGEKFSKTNFLGIYGRAHFCALIPENIKALFHKTGVWPFNPGVITVEMMAPSKETLCEGYLLIILAMPVCIIAKLLQKLVIHKEEGEDEQGNGSESENKNESESGEHKYVLERCGW